jgi:hypothetical protein
MGHEPRKLRTHWETAGALEDIDDERVNDLVEQI